MGVEFNCFQIFLYEMVRQNLHSKGVIMVVQNMYGLGVGIQND